MKFTVDLPQGFKIVYNTLSVLIRDILKWWHRSGRPREIITPEIIDKIHEISLSDRRVKLSEPVEASGSSHHSVVSILH